MAAVKAFSNQANGLYPRFLMIPVSIKHFLQGHCFLHLVQGATSKKVAPYNWNHTSWDPVKRFIKAEIESGRFIPNFPLDF